MQFKLFVPRGEAHVCKFPPDCDLLYRGGFMARLCPSLSYLLLSGLFPIRPMCRSHSASFRGFFRENCSICSCRLSVFVGGGGFGIFLHRHLGLERIYFYMGKYLRCIVKIFFSRYKTIFAIGFCFCKGKKILICEIVEKNLAPCLSKQWLSWSGRWGWGECETDGMMIYYQ